MSLGGVTLQTKMEIQSLIPGWSDKVYQTKVSPTNSAGQNLNKNYDTFDRKHKQKTIHQKQQETIKEEHYINKT